mgnify:CR=1 FL=1
MRLQSSRAVVGTTRVLLPEGALGAGRLYSESEFELSALQALRGGLMEVGRTCIDPAHRHGAVLRLLWQGLGHCLQSNGLQTLLGCTSVPVHDGGRLAVSAYWQCQRAGLVSPDWAVRPHRGLPFDWWAQKGPDLPMPALLQGYLRMGARICGQPAWDPQFGCADFLTLLHRENLSERHGRRFLRRPLNQSVEG